MYTAFTRNSVAVAHEVAQCTNRCTRRKIIVNAQPPTRKPRMKKICRHESRKKYSEYIRARHVFYSRINFGGNTMNIHSILKKAACVARKTKDRWRQAQNESATDGPSPESHALWGPKPLRTDGESPSLFLRKFAAKIEQRMNYEIWTRKKQSSTTQKLLWRPHVLKLSGTRKCKNV